MLISYRWLARHVDLEGLDAHRVAELLTLHTAEVEGVEPFAPALSEVVVGHVLERVQHPDADKLGVCRVDVGAHAGGTEPLQIVCGAPNVAAGQKVAVARIGSVLPGDFKIKKSKIRGVESVGMICSVRELGLGDDHDGIWVLDADAPVAAPVGTPVAAALEVDDWVIEIDNKSLTHRPDLWGHRGIAREIAALTGRALRPLDTALPTPSGAATVQVDVQHPGCSRYVAVAIDGVRATESPRWLRMLLLAVGQRPIDLLVDTSNFVMLDIGQPNHLFDRRALGGRPIVVRGARAGETMATLDGVERALTTDDMLICAGDEPVALAGVMGGAGSKVAEGTTELLLEVACFDPSVVRRTAARVGLRTDSSTRFEKHLDPLLPLTAAGHVVQVLRSIQPDVTVAGPVVEGGTWTDPTRTIDVRPQRVRHLLGTPVDDERIASIFESLDLAVERRTPDTWRVTVPARRATKDLTIEEDLVEEVGRVLGYDTIVSTPMLAPVAPAPRDRRRELVRLLADRLSGTGRFHEALTYSFVDESLVSALGLGALPYAIAVNPVAEGMARIRRSVAPSLIGKLETNLAQRSEVRLFEIGKGTRPEQLDERGQPHEVHRLALVLARANASGSPSPSATLGELQTLLTDALGRTGAGAVDFVAAPVVTPDDHAWAHPRRRMAIQVGGSSVGLVGALDPRAAARLCDGADVAVAEVCLDALLELGLTPPSYRPIPRFPGVKVDVALATPGDRPAREVMDLIEKAGKGLVASTELFDVYRGEGLGDGRKSLAWHVVLQAADRTLTEKDQNTFLDRLERMATQAGAELRRQ
ncbi:Phenylalanine--tRNA ligase beta subunit [Planctomycetes bacterium Pla163]|uniref:Phenylalanine--tRNA ligase beta subunit n=1 Tax=Rohdeia mirabilis TaxID=2528008 RepID=A0A518D062_9BACT|nr:Phenylalanine--tRNA ligase beta subunit [Planctomycetes bacterium Pla163]